jgi:hypothetical protein
MCKDPIARENWIALRVRETAGIIELKSAGGKAI